MANAVEKKDILFSSALIKHKLQMLKIQKSNKSRVFYLIFLSFIVIMIMIFSCYHRYYNYRFLYHHYDNWYFCFHFYHFVECPNLTFKHSSYIISLSGESWRSNRGACQRQGGDLVSIETEEEWNFINNESQKRNAAHYQNKWSVGLKKLPEIGPGWVEDRWLFANGDKGSQVVNTTRLSYTSGPVMANGACLVVLIVELRKTGSLLFVRFRRVSFLFCFCLFIYIYMKC